MKHNAAARALLRAGFGPAPAGTFALEGAVKPEELCDKQRDIDGDIPCLYVSYMFHIYVSCMFHICFIYVSDMFQICFRYVSDMFHICFKFHILVCFIYGRIWACIYCIYIMKYVEQECN